jgi:hypothetical protein
MWFRRVLLALPAFIALLLPGCGTGPSFVAKYEPWREEEENACIASGVVRNFPYLQTRSALGGPSYCGTVHPFEMSTADQGRVALKPAALLRCPMIPQVERWVHETVAPAARYYFASSLVEIKVAGSYSCRPMNNVLGARLSEHGYANAVDISGFMLEDGRTITVKKGWRGDEREQAFLRDVHQGGCREFMTVLGPNYDGNHHDHFHLDLARHGGDGLKRICK